MKAKIGIVSLSIMKQIIFFTCVFFFTCCSSPKEVRKKGGIQYQESGQERTMSPMETIAIPELLEEISGLLVVEDRFWGFNDSGGEPEIYELSNANQYVKAEILKTVKLKGVENSDFESIAMSDTQFFIGDFGNNYGNREDLSIHYFNRSEINDHDDSQKVDVKTIQFYYPEQEDYSNQNRNHDFDCEAMFYHNGRLHFFTKEWKSTQTHHYTVEIKSGKQEAKLIESFDTQFMVTGADAIELDGRLQVGLVGYTIEGEVYLLQTLVDASEEKFFSSSATKKFLGSSIELGQVEGIAYASMNEFCLSAERFKFDQVHVPEHIACFTFTNEL